MGSPECSVSLKPLYPWSSLAFGDMAESVDLRADVVDMNSAQLCHARSAFITGEGRRVLQRLHTVWAAISNNFGG